MTAGHVGVLRCRKGTVNSWKKREDVQRMYTVYGRKEVQMSEGMPTQSRQLIKVEWGSVMRAKTRAES